MSLRKMIAFSAIMFMTIICNAAAFADDCAREATLTSQPGGSTTDISFHNGSSAQRRLYWIDNVGKRQLKAVIEPGGTQRQPTIAAHAWVVTDAAEKCLYIVTASAAPMMVEIGSGPAAARSSTTARYALSGFYQIKSQSRSGFSLNNLKNGLPELEQVKNDWESAYWKFEDVPGTQYVTIANKWSGKLLNVDRGSLFVMETSPSSEAAHWELEGASDGPYGRVKNRRSGRYLVATASGFEFTASPGTGKNGFWQFSRSGVQSEPVVAKPRPLRCASDERFDEGRLECVSKRCSRHEKHVAGRGCVSKASLCTRHQVYSSSVAQCLPKSSLCEKNQVYSSSLAQCIAKADPKPTPKVPACKFKTDGAGNCLTPKFQQCQKSFAACVKGCKGLPKCKAACNKTFSKTCPNE